jgi:rhodanese-related sulfurtransferase
MGATSITPTEFWRRHEFERGTMLIDVSEPAQFECLHAEGAVQLPASDLSQLAKQAKICHKQLYLISRHGHLAAGLATEFERRGLDNVSAIAGGTEAWRASRLPVRREHAPAEDLLCAAASLIVIGSIVSAIFVSSIWMLPLLAVGGFVAVALVLCADNVANCRIRRRVRCFSLGAKNRDSSSCPALHVPHLPCPDHLCALRMTGWRRMKYASNSAREDT